MSKMTKKDKIIRTKLGNANLCNLLGRKFGKMTILSFLHKLILVWAHLNTCICIYFSSLFPYSLRQGFNFSKSNFEPKQQEGPGNKRNDKSCQVVVKQNPRRLLRFQSFALSLHRAPVKIAKLLRFWSIMPSDCVQGTIRARLVPVFWI